LPFGFWINALIDLIGYIGLELVTPSIIDRVKKKWGNTLMRRKNTGIESNRATYQQEVNQLADEISRILKTDLDESMLKDPKLIELKHVENHLRRDDQDSEKNEKKNRTT
jgi:hypothetical protein